MQITRKTSIITALFLVLIAAAAEQAARAEAVFLKEGPIVIGKIVSDTKDSLTVQTEDGKKVVVKRAEVMRILYTKLKMGKVFIQKRDGKGLTAYIVDEDQDSYTCRSELFQPAEFNIKRSDILFLAEKNPSGLQVVGNVGTDKVTLTWFPPYGEVKKYNVYIKEKDKDKYELAGSTRSKTITIEKIKSNTSFFLIVTSVDMNDYESPPSNEIRITTANIHPTRPVVTSTSRSVEKGTTIAWEPSTDPDGQVTAYRIYAWKMDKREKLADGKSTEFTFENPSSLDKAEVVAVDNRGDESEPAPLPFFGEFFSAGFYPGGVLPLGKLGKIIGPGFGGTLTFTMNNYFYESLSLGVEAGFNYITGKDALSTEGKKTKSSYMATAYLTAGYNYRVSTNLTFTPYLGAGLVYIYLDMTSRNKVTLVDKKETVTDMGPGAVIGASMSYRFTESLRGALRVSGGYLVGADMSFYAGCDLGFIYKI
jgi:fibronectin type 3 domain-containing protein